MNFATRAAFGLRLGLTSPWYRSDWNECQSPIASSACSTRSKAHSGPCLRLVPRNCEVLARFAGLTTTASHGVDHPL